MIQQNKTEIFSELRSHIFNYEYDTSISDSESSVINLSSLKTADIIEEIKALKVIELDNLESFISYTNYDHFLIFKVNNDYYFCDIELIPSLHFASLILLNDYKQYIRKDKLANIEKHL